MVGPAEIAAIVAAVKGSIEIFDRIGGQIKSVLLDRPKEAEGSDDRWRYKILPEGTQIVVKQENRTIQTLTADELASKLSSQDLAVVTTYEEKMEEYFVLWQSVYKSKDGSQDPLINAKTELQLKMLIKKMKGELIGILKFLNRLGVQLDDHYRHIWGLIESD